LNPYKKYGFTWIPAQLWEFKNYKRGIRTICLHPNTITEKAIEELVNGLENNKHNMRDVAEIPVHSHLTLLDRASSLLFFTRLRYKRIKQQMK
jgi:hypothetical protein